MIRLAKATAIIAATLLGLATVWELRGPALVLLLSLIVAAAARGPVDFLANRGWPRFVALAGTYAVSLLIPAALGAGNDLRGEQRAWAVDGGFQTTLRVGGQVLVFHTRIRAWARTSR